MYSIKLIGIGAIARVGKDTLADCLINLFERDGCVAKKYSLAAALKNDLKDFLNEKCQMNVWSDNSEEKSKFRDLLVEYGKVQRDRTNGTHWTRIVENQIEEDHYNLAQQKPFVAIVPDIRYAEYDGDEHMWVKSRGGSLIYLDRILNGKLIEPANLQESTNAPKIKSCSNHHIVWETVGDVNIENICKYHYSIVNPLYNKVKFH
jgi:hypothetical protein